MSPTTFYGNQKQPLIMGISRTQFFFATKNMNQQRKGGFEVLNGKGGGSLDVFVGFGQFDYFGREVVIQFGMVMS